MRFNINECHFIFVNGSLFEVKRGLFETDDKEIIGKLQKSKLADELKETRQYRKRSEQDSDESVS